MRTPIVVALAALLSASQAVAEEAVVVPVEATSEAAPAATESAPEASPSAPASDAEQAPAAAPMTASSEAKPAPEASTPAPVTVAPVETAPTPPAAVATAAPEQDWQNDLSLEAGWNTPTGQGLRYLRRLGHSHFSVGAGVGYAARWGWKFSVQARFSGKGRAGTFIQVSGSLLPGTERTSIDVTDVAGNQVSRPFQLTRAGTIDVGLGHRWGGGRAFFELICGYSFNVRGTAFQLDRAAAVRLSESTRSELSLQSPGGIVAGASAGLRF